MSGRFLSIGCVILGVSAFGAMASPSAEPNPPKNFARMVGMHELQRAHWSGFVSGMDSKEHRLRREWFAETMNAMVPDSLDFSWETRFIASSSGIENFKGDTPGKWEAAEIAATKKKGESWHEAADGTWRYLAPIPSKQTCLFCHAGGDSQVEDKPIGFVSITFTRKGDEKKEVKP